jgi:predicted ATPase/DNA-binding CsgD family transcriptional regulator
LIGREEEIAETKRSIAGWRLVTLSGSGGVGKTRLALRAAADLVPHFRDGVRWVELSSLADPSLLPDALAQALGLRPRRGQGASELLVEYLRPRSLLLVLDNCEHLVRACAELVDDLLAGCPLLRVLTTSREPLSLLGEAILVVPSLSLPNPNELADSTLQSDSVRLFADRVTAVLPDFRVSDRNASAVAQICLRLDGLPLAIELAAARVPMLSVEQIAVGLDDRFWLLTAGNRAAVPRQRTLRATVDWSHDLLSDAERMLFRRLAVFSGSWSLEAVDAVCTGNGLESREVLDLLAGLTTKSLVLVQHRAQVPRYRLLETLRQYGSERLAEAGESAEFGERHARFFLTLVETAEPHLWGPEQATWLDRLEWNHDNLRGALAWFMAGDEPDLALRLGVALWRFWDMRGFLTEGSRRLEAVLLRSPVPTAIRAEALLGLAFLYRDRGDERGAISLADESLAIFRRIQDEHGAGRALAFLGDVTRATDLDRSASFLKEGFAILETVGDDLHAAYALLNLAITAESRGDRARSRAMLDDCLSRFRRLGDGTGIAWVLGELGSGDLLTGDDRRAEALFRESLAEARKAGDRRVLTWVHGRLGDLELHRGRWNLAAAHWRESLSLARDVGDEHAIAEGLVRLGAFAHARGNIGRAARLLGAADALFERQDGLKGAIPSMTPALVAALNAHDASASSQSLFQEGREWSLGAAVDDALALDERAERGNSGAGAKRDKPVLTPRELEVGAFVARGLTNRQIAERLVLSERTVDAHLERIRNRLGVRSRAEIAAWLVERGLVLGKWHE